MIADKTRLCYSINGELKACKDLKKLIMPINKGVAWVSRSIPAKFNKPRTVLVKRMKITKEALLPGRNLCTSTNPFGIYSGNKPVAPVRGYIPCPKTTINLGTSFTLKFKIIPRNIVSPIANLFGNTGTKNNFYVHFYAKTFQMKMGYVNTKNQ